jgi:anti-sigma factor RsiW
MMELSDELLVAYVDGQLDRPQAATLARLLGEDDELAKRVRRLQQTQARLMESFASMQRDIECGGLEEMIAGVEGRRSSVAAFGSSAKWAAVVALLSLGGVAGFSASYYVAAPIQIEQPLKNTARMPTGGAPAEIVQQPQAPQQPQPAAIARAGVTGATNSATPVVNWTDELAGYHMQLTKESSSGQEGPSNRDLAPFQLASLAGRPLPVPDFSKQGLTLARSLMLPFKGSRLMQLSYSSAGKTEPAATLYIIPGASSAGAEPLAFGASGDVRAAGWSMDGVRYVIAGRLPPDALRVLAAVAQSQMSKRA